MSVQRTVLIATPIMDGRPDYRYVASLLASTDRLRTERIGYAVQFKVGSSLVADARNKLVAAFLAGGWDDMVFIDADIAWQPEDLLRLLRWDVPLVAAAYPRKTDPLKFTVKFGPVVRRRGELVLADRVGTGFLRLRRDCLERMVQGYPQTHVLDPLEEAGGPGYHALFDCGVYDGVYTGEDYVFCDRWRALGGEVLVAPDIRLQHVGTRVWDGMLSDHLRPHPGAGR